MQIISTGDTKVIRSKEMTNDTMIINCKQKYVSNGKPTIQISTAPGGPSSIMQMLPQRSLQSSMRSWRISRADLPVRERRDLNLLNWHHCFV